MATTSSVDDFFDRPGFTWTIDRYHQAIDEGVLGPDNKVELLFVKIVPKRTTGAPFAETLAHLLNLCWRLFGDEKEYRAQGSDSSTDFDSLIPELAILGFKQPNEHAYHSGDNGHWLSIGVFSDRIVYDRGARIPYYQQSGIPEVWSVDFDKELIAVMLEGSENSVIKKGGMVNSFNYGEVNSSELLPDLNRLHPIFDPLR